MTTAIKFIKLKINNSSAALISLSIDSTESMPPELLNKIIDGHAEDMDPGIVVSLTLKLRAPKWDVKNVCNNNNNYHR